MGHYISFVFKTNHMKKITLLFLFNALVINVLLSQKTVTIGQVPSSVDEFIQMRNTISKTPEGGAAMFILATKLYIENEELGKKCLVIAADRSELRKGDVYKGFDLASWHTINSQVAKNNLVANSYIQGSSPENGYKVELPYKMVFKTGTYSGDPATGKIKIFVECSGADSDRPIHMVKNDKGLWKTSKWSSLFAGLRPPKQEISDDL